MTLAAKLVAVMADVDGITKSGKNESQGYAFVRATDVAQVVRAALVKHGVALTIAITSVDHKFIDRPNKPPLIFTTVQGEAVLHDAEDGSAFVVPIAGTGADYGGSVGVYKAITGAVKAFLRASFLIPDESSDPETTRSDEHSEGAAPAAPAGVFLPGVVTPATAPITTSAPILATPDMKAMLRAEARKVKLDGDAFKAWMISITGKASSKDLTSADIDVALAALKDADTVEDFATATYGEAAGA